MKTVIFKYDMNLFWNFREQRLENVLVYENGHIKQSQKRGKGESDFYWANIKMHLHPNPLFHYSRASPMKFAVHAIAVAAIGQPAGDTFI